MIFDERILNQIDELIRLGQEVLGTQRSPGANVIGDDRVDAETAKHWATRTQSLLSRVFGETSSYYKNFVELTSKYITFTPAKQAFGVLRAAREDYAGGFLIELRNPMTAGMKQDPRKVFVVHGRNEDLRRSLFAFLRAIGLVPIEWSEAVRLTGKPAPYIGEILEAAFSDAQAVVVLLTPDDEAKLREELLHPNDPDYERYPTGQARPNVIFEAGMSFARHAERTILIEVGELRPFSDVAGRYTLRLNNSPGKRMELVERLKTALCKTETEGKSDWLNEGDFEVPLIKTTTVTRSNATRRLLSTPPVAPSAQLETSVVLDCVKRLGSIDIFQPPLTRNLISAKLHKQATLETDAHIETAFEQLNQQRHAAGKQEYYSHPRYRIIRRPQIRETANQREYVLELAEMDFQYFALLHEQNVGTAMKEYIRKKVDTVATSLPSHFQSADPYLNPKNVGMLGVQMVLITSDNYTLLRRRGKHVMEYSGAWDVSFSGYCGRRVFENGQFNIGNTVEFELDQEIRRLRGDPREISLTGLHLSTANRTTVMLGFWKVEATRSELKSFLHEKSKEKSQDEALVFDTTILPKETYVWDYKNMIVEFDGPIIAQALHTAEVSLTNQPYTLVPAARASLLLALNAQKKPTDGLIV